MIHGIAILELEEDVSSIEEKDRKSQVYTEMQKSSMTKSDNRVFESAAWASQSVIKDPNNQISKTDMVLIQGDQKNRGRWNIGIVMKLNRGRGVAVAAAAKLKIRKTTEYEQEIPTVE